MTMPPKVHYVRESQKDYLEDGITKGDAYYWWRFRSSETRRKSLVPPRTSQLILSRWAGVFRAKGHIEGAQNGSLIELQRAIVEAVEMVRKISRDYWELEAKSSGVFREGCEERASWLEDQGDLLAGVATQASGFIAALTDDAGPEDKSQVQKRISSLVEDLLWNSPRY